MEPMEPYPVVQHSQRHWRFRWPYGLELYVDDPIAGFKKDNRIGPNRFNTEFCFQNFNLTRHFPQKPLSKDFRMFLCEEFAQIIKRHRKTIEQSLIIHHQRIWRHHLINPFLNIHLILRRSKAKVSPKDNRSFSLHLRVAQTAIAVSRSSTTTPS